MTSPNRCQAPNCSASHDRGPHRVDDRFFIASYFIKRWMDDNDIPKSMTRSVAIFVLAVAVAYGVGWLVDRIV